MLVHCVRIHAEVKGKYRSDDFIMYLRKIQVVSEAIRNSNSKVWTSSIEDGLKLDAPHMNVMYFTQPITYCKPFHALSS